MGENIEEITDKILESGGLEQFTKENSIESITKAYRKETSTIINIGDPKTRMRRALVNKDNFIKWKTPSGEVKYGWYPFFIAKACEKLVKGEDFKMAIVGQTGRGKSMKALHIADILHNEIGILHGSWDTDLQIYDVKEFLKTLSFKETDVINGFLKCYIFDECARTLAKENYLSRLNRAVRQALNLQRVRQNVYIFVLPYFEKLDSGVRHHVDMMLKCEVSKKRARAYYNIKHHEKEQKAEASEWKREKNVWRDIPLPRKELRRRYRVKESLEKFRQPDVDLEKIRQKEMEELEKAGDSLGIL